MNVNLVGSYFKRAVKLYPDFVLGTGNESFSKALKETVKNRKAANQGYFESVWSGVKNGAKAAETHNANMVKRDGGFWQSTWKALKTTPDKIRQGWTIGGKLADKAGKTGFSKTWTQFKGSMSGLGKRMPLIGTLLIAVTELPNIISAFGDGGVVGGVTETVKTGLRLGAGMTGAAIGQALIPIPVVGGLVGYLAGDTLMSLITGKSHSEKKAEAEEQQQALINNQQQALEGMQQQIAQQNTMQYPIGTTNPFATAQPTMTPQQLMALRQQLYNGGAISPMDQDFMAMASGLNRINYMG